MSLVNIHTQWDPLEEIIVGSVYDPSTFQDANVDKSYLSYMKRILEETEEDLDKLVALLASFDVEVKRPKILFQNDDQFQISSLEWSHPHPPLWPRDISFVVGNKILTGWTGNLSRYFETWSLYDHFVEYFQSGAEWIQMPSFIPKTNEKYIGSIYQRHYQNQMLFHGTQLMRCGKDIFSTIPRCEKNKHGIGTSLGMEWFKRTLETYGYNLWTTELEGGHIDGRLALIKPGLVVSWQPKDKLPSNLQKWDHIHLDYQEMCPTQWWQDYRNKEGRFRKEWIEKYLSDWVGNFEETYFNVNMLVVNQETVISTNCSKLLSSKLKPYGIEVIPFPFRHAHFWDGGVHCLTLDIRRKGKLESYF